MITHTNGPRQTISQEEGEGSLEMCCVWTMNQYIGWQYTKRRRCARDDAPLGGHLLGLSRGGRNRAAFIKPPTHLLLPYCSSE